MTDWRKQSQIERSDGQKNGSPEKKQNVQGKKNQYFKEPKPVVKRGECVWSNMVDSQIKMRKNTIQNH